MPYRNPDNARHYQREYRRLRRAGDCCTTPVHPQVPVSFRLRTAADVLKLIEEQIEAVRGAPKGSIAFAKARTIGFLAGVALRAIEAGNMAARVEALESVLKTRNGNGKP